MLDGQLLHLSEVLANKRIWALNVGENFQTTSQAWDRFTRALTDTAVAYLYVSEQHLRNTDLKTRMRDVIRINRRFGSARPSPCFTRSFECPALRAHQLLCEWCRAGPVRDSEVIKRVGNMWWNPKMPTTRRLTPTTFDSSMAALKQHCFRDRVPQAQFDRIERVRRCPYAPVLRNNTLPHCF